MDPSACAETTVEMWCLVNSKLIARRQTNLDPLVQAQILSESMKLYMTHIIQEQRIDERASKEAKQEEPATAKQLQYIEDLHGDPKKVKTKKEASEYIEDLRK